MATSLPSLLVSNKAQTAHSCSGDPGDDRDCAACGQDDKLTDAIQGRRHGALICGHHVDAGKACACVATYEAIVAGEEIPKLAGYCAIVREAAKHPDLLRSYASDLLVHDRAFLTDYAGPFLWVLRDLGTVCVKPGSRPGGITVDGIVCAFGVEKTRWYWWTGRELRHLTGPNEAADLLAEASAAPSVIS